MITTLALWLSISLAPAPAPAPPRDGGGAAGTVAERAAKAEPSVAAEPAAKGDPAARSDPAARTEPDLPRSEPPELAAPELDLGWTLVRTAVVLGMVVALAYLTLNVGLRKLLGIQAPGGARMVNVLERVQLDQRRSLFVVEVAGEVLLLGGSEASLGLVCKLDPGAVAALKAGGGGGNPTSVRLSPLLQKLLGRGDSLPPKR